MRDYTPPATDAKAILHTPVHFIAFGFGSGLSPKAPGTMGTLAALPIWWLMSGLPVPAYLGLCALLFGVGCWVCGESARRLGVHDHGGIVFDEIVGFLFAALPLLIWSATAWWLVVAFALFRVFDILKPWPIRTLDTYVKGGIGIMLDDLIAGLFAAVLLGIALHYLPSW